MFPINLFFPKTIPIKIPNKEDAIKLMEKINNVFRVIENRVTSIPFSFSIFQKIKNDCLKLIFWELETTKFKKA